MVSKLHIIAVVATLVVTARAATTNYCNLKTCGEPNHSICKYGLLTVNRNECGDPKSTGLTRSEIEGVVNLHNSYRAKVARGLERRGNPGPQPAATNMRNLSWDTELANIAQTWANQCHYGHDQCRDSARFQVGQNIASKGSTAGYTAKFTDMITMWYEEVQDFNKKQVKSVTDFNDVGHYTQMLWADTKLVGCGGVRYKAREWYRTYLVCNYGPTGNWMGQEMYKTR